MRAKKLCFGFVFTSHKKAAKIPILLYDTKSSFDLNRAVHSQEYSFFGSDPLGRFCLLPCHRFGEPDLAVAVLTFVALLAVRATFTVFANVIGFYDFITVLCFALAVVSVLQFLPVGAGETVADFVITEIFNTVNILLVFARFANLIIGGFLSTYS